MNKFDYLKFIGITPVLPNRDFPGAAPSDSFGASWQLYLREKSPALEQAAAYIANADKPVKQPSNSHRGALPSQAQATQKNDHLDAAVADLSSNEQAVSSGDVNFVILVWLNTALNTVILAELAPNKQPEQMHLLQNIVQSFSGEHMALWQKKMFNWPLTTPALLHLSQQQGMATARDTLIGFLEALQTPEPQHVLCFTNHYLPQLLGAQNIQNNPAIEKLVLEYIWPSRKASMLPALTHYLDNKNAKANLWQYIKQDLLANNS